MGQTVNLLSFDFGGSNPSAPTNQLPNHRIADRTSPAKASDRRLKNRCGSSSVDRASAFQAEGREFEPRLPL